MLINDKKSAIQLNVNAICKKTNLCKNTFHISQYKVCSDKIQWIDQYIYLYIISFLFIGRVKKVAISRSTSSSMRLTKHVWVWDYVSVLLSKEANWITSSYCVIISQRSIQKPNSGEPAKTGSWLCAGVNCWFCADGCIWRALSSSASRAAWQGAEHSSRAADNKPIDSTSRWSWATDKTENLKRAIHGRRKDRGIGQSQRVCSSSFWPIRFWE